MYYVRDLYRDEWKEFKSREDLIGWCGRKKNFSKMLNVTGKDYYACKEFRGLRYDDDGFVHPVFEWSGYWLRRYQVFDKNHRSIDIRLWPDSIWDSVWDSYPEWLIPFWGSTGTKRHRRRVSGPSMAHSTSRQNTDCVDFEELDEEGLPAPERDRTALRCKALVSDTDYWDYIDSHWNCCRRPSRSWKDQHKSRKQWGKHKHVPRIHQEIPENGEELAARLTAELVSKPVSHNADSEAPDATEIVYMASPLVDCLR